MKKLLILSYTDACHDPRVWRQIQFFSKYYSVTVGGLADPQVDGVAFLPIIRQPKKSLGEVWRALGMLVGIDALAQQRFRLLHPESIRDNFFDLVLCNDAEPLPLAFAMGKGMPVIFDAHEYYPLEFEYSLKWCLFFKRYLTRLCREYIPQCAAMTTVCEGIAQEYYHMFGVLPTVVHSGPEYHALDVQPADPEHISLVHHGRANPDRGIEQMLETVRLLDSRFSLDFYLVGDEKYLQTLRTLANDIPAIYWRTPLPMHELTRALNSYDMGLYILEARGFNNTHALPNKFFEFIQARLALAVGPSPEMANIIREHGLGVVASDFSPQAMASVLNALSTEDIVRYKKNADRAAQIYTAENEMATLHTVLTSVSNGKHKG